MVLFGGKQGGMVGDVQDFFGKKRPSGVKREFWIKREERWPWDASPTRGGFFLRFGWYREGIRGANYRPPVTFSDIDLQSRMRGRGRRISLKPSSLIHGVGGRGARKF